ncbi:arrestin domain-containing protein 3-like [Contarinia nasturtii]|uniref:arrestin domain-containing protein 3-like n=1 Tax=Contarinia nasturtii TaxID=265458 RepID=UPI0012D403BC|nr:arrestin domain-containing protein 3-like [Contarinia nasturtii]
MTTCNITFENNSMKIVHSGQSIRGAVQLNLNRDINVRGIYIHMYGGAYTSWRDRLQLCKTHADNEDYLNQRTYLVGATNGHIRLAAGTYNYTFNCKLQSSLPTSFEGKHGFIRYTALVVVDHQNSKEKTFSEPFTVIRDINLNYNPELRNRIIVEKEKLYKRSLILFCWCPDPIKLIIRTPVAAYTPGQVINLDIIVDNKSAVPISNFIALLIREVTYTKPRDSNDQRVERTTITKEIGDGCDKYKNKIILLNIKVPSTPPTDATASNLIKIEYYVHIIGTMPCCRANIRTNFPITIGTFPLRNNMTIQSNQMSNTNSPHSSRNGFSTSYEDDEPPIYKETVQSKGKANTNFKPKYAVFNHTTAYSRSS